MKGQKNWIFDSSGYQGIVCGMVEVVGVISRKAAKKIFWKYDLEVYDADGIASQYVVYRYLEEGTPDYNQFEDCKMVMILPKEIFMDHTEEVR